MGKPVKEARAEDVLIDLAQASAIVVNGIVSISYFGSLFNVVLGNAHAGVGTDGKLQAQTAIVARLRFDLEMAKIIHSRLGEQIKALIVPPREKAN